MDMKNMLALSINSYTSQGGAPNVSIGQGPKKVYIQAGGNLPDSSYWILILDANNPQSKVKEFVVPGGSNSKVPDGLDAYMSNTKYLFVLTTKSLITYHVPQGDFFDYLVKYGAGRELQRLEQINSVYGCGAFGHVSYILTGQCGPRGSGINPPSYEVSGINGSSLLLMSVMAQPNGQPPYVLCNNYTYITRP
jgi:hypothetical protein